MNPSTILNSSGRKVNMHKFWSEHMSKTLDEHRKGKAVKLAKEMNKSMTFKELRKDEIAADECYKDMVTHDLEVRGVR